MKIPTILLVEDNPGGEALILRAFKMSNQTFDTVVVRDGAEALDYVFHTGEFQNLDADDQPIMVLLDLKLPEIDGMEVLRRIRDNEKTRFLPVVIFTTSDNEQDIIEAYGLGANSFVQKPGSLSDLNQTVADIARYWCSINRPAPQMG